LALAFSAARERILALQQQECADPRINPACGTILLEHGRATARAVVFLHGITASPVQFRQLGELFHERGYNVLIPRLPAHGYRDRLSREHGDLTQADYVAFAQQAITHGRGLGEHLTIAGLSVSGVLAAWSAQFADGVDAAVLIAPAFGPLGVPVPAIRFLSRVALRLPNYFIWWDPRKRERLGPECSLPRFATHAMAESFLLGCNVFTSAQQHPPRASTILSIINSRDPAVNNNATRAIMRAWRRHGNVRVGEYRFGRTLGPLHDVIAPYQPNARTDRVYPKIFELIDSAQRRL
jgi:pimeloyl-ACP methyl ester carboxylesterase